MMFRYTVARPSLHSGVDILYSYREKTMRKLTLKVEELRVEAFVTTAGRDPVRGTIRGYDSNYGLTYGVSACSPWSCNTLPDCSADGCYEGATNDGRPSCMTCEGPGCTAQEVDETL